VPKVKSTTTGAEAIVAALDRALGAVLRPVADMLPRRLRRVAERIERRRTRPLGQIAAVCFLLATVLYGLVVGGQLGRVGDAALVVAGFGIENVEINGYKETSELAILEKLEIAGSLVGYDVAAAQDRVATLPWVARATVRKFYPSTLSVKVEERDPFALWQYDGEVFVIDRAGTKIVALEEARFAELPFMVGEGANERAGEFLSVVGSEPALAARIRAAVLVAGRRWDLHLEDGVTVKLPEKDIGAALRQLVKLHAERQLLDRDIIVVDLRLPDRITVRLPEGRSLEEVTGGKDGASAGKART